MTPKTIAATLALALSATTYAAPAAVARESRASNGMGRGDGPCIAVATPTERAIIRPESGGWPTADNPTSTAYGCSQALLAIRRRYAPRCGSRDPGTVNVAVQMCIFRSYVRDRYGSMDAALRFRRRHGWY